MKKIKLFKTLLIPSLGVLTLGMFAAVATSCGRVNVIDVSLSETKISLNVGDSKRLEVFVHPDDATDKSVTWTSSNETVATVEDGKVTAIREGTATITVRSVNNPEASDQCTVYVTAPVIHVNGVSLNEHNLSLAEDDTTVLTATVSPADATDKSVTWTSSDTNVATVEDGQVTAVGEGTATINVTTNDGHYTDTCEVTVNERIVPVVVTANVDSTLELINHDNNPDLQYSTDDGTSWNTYSEEISISQGQTLLLKGNNPNGWSTSRATYSNFNITGDVSLSGNIMALIDNGKGTATAAIPNEYCFYSLFKNSTGITSISKNFLPATSLAEDCYYAMFYECTNLRNAPDELPATTLADDCYCSMFEGCTSLTAVPNLPATELASICYAFMFRGCNSLTKAPDLPATTLAEDCYYGMFYDCSSLNSIRIGYTGTAAAAVPSDAFTNWVKGVANTGTFYYNGDQTQTAQDFGFPEGWQLQPYNW